MTSIEWLIEKMQNKIHHTIKIPSYYVEQAKEMHKKEIIDVFFEGAYGGDNISGEQYYQETFVSKGSGMSEKPNNHIEAQLPQQEISDGSKGRYREQLKQKK